MLAFITGAPIYVWPLLIVLIVLGLHSTRDRTTSIIPMLALPFLGLAGLSNLLDMPLQGTTWASYGVAYIFGLMIGWRVQGRFLVERVGLRAQLRGEWVTFFMMMAIFWSSYALGVTTAVAPDVLLRTPFAIGFPVLEGIGAGFFLGRIIRVLRS